MRSLVVTAAALLLALPAGAQGFWSPPVIIPELSSGSSDYYPYLSADLMTARVASSRNDLTPPPSPAGGWHIWMATRLTRNGPFGPMMPEPGAVQTSVNDLAPWVSGDGLTMYSASNSTSLPTAPVGGFDIWEWTRPNTSSPWAFASNVTPLNTTSTDYMPSSTSDNLEIYSTSSGVIIGATRPTTGSPWSVATPVASLAGHGHSGVSGNGLEMYTAMGGQLFVSTRPSRQDAFGAPTAITAVNNQASGSNNRPSLAVDGRELFFSSSRPTTTPGLASNNVWRSTWTGLSIQGRPLIGQAMQIHVTNVSRAGGGYQVAMSWGSSGIPLPGVGTIPLAPDSLFFLSITNVLPSVFQNFQGTLNINGEATATLNTPNIPAILGIGFNVAAIASSGSGPDYISNGIALKFDQ